MTDDHDLALPSRGSVARILLATVLVILDIAVVIHGVRFLLGAPPFEREQGFVPGLVYVATATLVIVVQALILRRTGSGRRMVLSAAVITGVLTLLGLVIAVLAIVSFFDGFG